MANRSYVNPADDDFEDLQDDDQGSDSAPYSSISSRGPIQDVNPAASDTASEPPPPMDPQRAPATAGPNPAIRDFIAQRSANSTPKAPLALDKDPMMQQYLKEQSDLDDYRNTKLHADTQANLGQAFSQLAGGTNAPVASPVFSNIAKQNQELVSSKEADSDRKRKVMDAIEARNSRETIAAGNREDRGLRRQELNLNRQNSMKDREDKETTKRFDDLGKRLTSEVASSRSAFGVAAKNKQAVENAEALLKGETDFNNLDTRQVYELSKVLDRILSNGSPTISGSDHLDPQTVARKTQGLLEQITNKRRGAQAGDFVKNMSHTLDREKIQANQQIRSTQQKLMGSYGDLKKKNPEKWDQLMTAHGLGETEDSGGDLASGMSAAKETANPGMVRMIAPDGSIRMVPADKVDMALQAGGKRAE